ncbi:hypothetical protein ES703_118846 [subsurface metagenome]
MPRRMQQNHMAVLSVVPSIPFLIHNFNKVPFLALRANFYHIFASGAGVTIGRTFRLTFILTI